MAWQNSLNDMRDELADVRARRLKRAESEDAKLEKLHQDMTALVESLAVSKLLAEMNATLLDGDGEIGSIVSWDEESSEEKPDPDARLGGYKISSDAKSNSEADEEEDNEDAITTILSWDEDGDREIAVEVILDEEGISLQVNGVEIRPDTEALQQGLLEAFRDELEL